MGDESPRPVDLVSRGAAVTAVKVAALVVAWVVVAVCVAWLSFVGAMFVERFR